MFLGYPTLALGQRAEYQNILKTIADDMTRKSIRLKASAGVDKSEKIASRMTASLYDSPGRRRAGLRLGQPEQTGVEPFRLLFQINGFSVGSLAHGYVPPTTGVCKQRA